MGLVALGEVAIVDDCRRKGSLSLKVDAGRQPQRFRSSGRSAGGRFLSAGPVDSQQAIQKLISSRFCGDDNFSAAFSKSPSVFTWCATTAETSIP